MNTNAINLGQIQVEAGRPDLNMQKIKEQIINTKKGGILIVPEMVIPGYMIGDDWLYESYIKHINEFNDELINLSGEYGITIVWGNIVYDEMKKNEDGSIRKYNAAYLASEGKLLKTQYKTLLPNYRMFDDKRYFHSLKDLVVEQNLDNKAESIREKLEAEYKPVEVLIDGVKTKVSLLICEDIWNVNNDYAVDPVEMTKKHNTDMIAVVSASPFGLEKAKFRDKLLKIQSEGTTIAYVNPIGIQNNGKNIFNFDGGSSIYKNGEFIRGIKDYYENKSSPHSQNALPKGEGIATSSDIFELEHLEEPEQIFNALIYVIKEFWKQNGWEKALIGLSGGLDSGLVATLLVFALGNEAVTALNMPSKFNGDTTKSLAETLANNLKIAYKISDMERMIEAQVQDYRDLTGEEPTSFEMENIYARSRGSKLSNMAPKYGPYTNNGNKDEIITGYATLYGDVNGVMAVIGDLNKEAVRDVARWINKKYGEIIPSEMIEMQPAAELSDEQNVDNGGGDPFDYKVLRGLNRAYIENKKTIEDILKMIDDNNLEQFLGLELGYLDEVFATSEKQKDEAKKIWRLKTISYFKRVQSPPIPTITRSSFGFDRREAQNKPYNW
ncbi:MAG: NAD(+) synthase [Candidatus Gracilibacteria bacterium]|nr:NAD(+) synthase [Candidatus Gracilibacteria bacterium]